MIMKILFGEEKKPSIEKEVASGAGCIKEDKRDGTI
jgi:hypothetical protein